MTEQHLTPTAPSRRTVTKGAAWAIPAAIASSAAPAFASSPEPCAPAVTAYSLQSFEGYVDGANSTRQTFRVVNDYVNVTGLPAGSTITSIKQVYYVQARDDSVNEGRGPGAYDPGNSHVDEASCSTAYTQIDGCRWDGSTYPDTSGGVNVAPSNAIPVAPMWDLDNGASAYLSANWMDFDFKGTPMKVWQFTFEANPALAPISTDENGCVQMITKVDATDGRPSGTWAEGQGGTPQLTVNYTGVNPIQNPDVEKVVRTATRTVVTYELDGQEYTVYRPFGETVQNNSPEYWGTTGA